MMASKAQRKAARGAQPRRLRPRPAVAGQPSARLKPKAELAKVMHPRQQRVKLVVGYGKPDVAADIKRRHQQFLRQQREGKHPVRSIVRRAEQRGYQERIKGVEYKRGVPVVKWRVKQLAAGHAQYEVITDDRGRPIELKVSSSWVSMIHLVMFNGQPALAISFHSGFTALYPTTNIRDYEAMARAASKGKYVWAALYHGRPGQGAPYISIGF